MVRAIQSLLVVVAFGFRSWLLSDGKISFTVENIEHPLLDLHTAPVGDTLQGASF
jgi:hypothetical protein